MFKHLIENYIPILDKIIKPLIWISVGMFFLEVHLYKTDNSLESPWWFIWTERVIAGILTIEVILRAKKWNEEHGSWLVYFKHPLGWIDLLAVLPFWIGFFVPTGWLHMIRTLRVLRLLKFFRYSRSLQLVGLAFYRAWLQIKSLGFAMMIIALFSTVAMFEAEHKSQPEEFNDLFNSLWFTAVTVTTVGYGDISPVTLLGKVVAMCTFAVGLVVFAGIVGVLGSSFSQVLDEEINPDIDPIAEFAKTYNQHQKAKEIDQQHRAAD